MFFSRRLPVAVALALVAAASTTATATASSSSNAGFSASLVVAGSEKRDPQTVWVGLDVKLDPGWHTYWRSAGDAGAAPEFTWSDSRNVTDIEVEWPAPRRFTDAGIDTFGYAHRVLFPIKVRLRNPSETSHISMKTTLYVCSTICTRNDIQFNANIIPGLTFPDKRKLIDEWRNLVPRDQSPTLAIRSLKLEIGPPAQLKIAAMANPPLKSPDVFVYGDSAVSADRPQITQGYGGASFMTLPLHGVDDTHPDLPLHVTLVDGNRSVEATLSRLQTASADQTSVIATGPNGQANTSDEGSIKNTSLWSMIALSLFGGLILNFMPCVFPVLSLKFFSVVGHSIHDLGSIRMRFAASAAGVVASFVVLAAGLAALKAAGAQIGWGIQFQQPIFLITMAAILAALSASLLGLYEIRLPWWLAGTIGKSTDGQSVGAHFFNGFVMTLLATPCSAPFVGTAIAFALSQNSLQIFEIFLMLGIGMASPFLVVAAVPQVAHLFPRPGRWMLSIKYFAAAAMVATAIWLLTVLAKISGPQTALSIGAAFGIILWLLAVYRKRLARTIGVMLIMALAVIAITDRNIGSAPATTANAEYVHWQPLTPRKIQEMVRNGRTVFVDIGATWCLTCKVNEALIINSDHIRKRLISDVTPIKGDWTKPDDAITSYLRSFGRYGLPFNVVFGPGAPKGIVLPELLSEEAVLNAFNSASNRTGSN